MAKAILTIANVDSRDVAVLSEPHCSADFAETVVYEAAAIRLAEPTSRRGAWPTPTGLQARSTLRGDWTKARSLIERWITVVRTGDIFLQLSYAVACSAGVLAQLGEASEALNRLLEGEEHLERQILRGLVGQRRWV